MKNQAIPYTCSFKSLLLRNTTTTRNTQVNSSVIQVAMQIFTGVVPTVKNKPSNMAICNAAAIIVEILAYFASPIGVSNGNPNIIHG